MWGMCGMCGMRFARDDDCGGAANERGAVAEVAEDVRGERRLACIPCVREMRWLEGYWCGTWQCTIEDLYGGGGVIVVQCRPIVGVNGKVGGDIEIC